MKEDFIVVHLREPCSFCRKYISGGLRCVSPGLVHGHVGHQARLSAVIPLCIDSCTTAALQ